MQFHEARSDRRGTGRWDIKTTRYVPFSGGSRSRLPVIYSLFDDIRRYNGGVGMSDKLSESINTVGKLYAQIGGGILVTEQTAAYISRLVEQSGKWMQGAVESE